MGEEARRKGATALLAPRLALAAAGAARAGARAAESLAGEDPTLGAALGSAAVRGIQSQGVVAAAAALSAAGALAGAPRASARARRELAYPPLAAAVAAGLGGVACEGGEEEGWQAANGTGACGDAAVLEELREATGFQGFVLAADAAAAAHSAGDAAALALAGADLRLGGGAAEDMEVVGEGRWREAAARVLAPMVSVGLLEKPPLPREAAEANVRPPHPPSRCPLHPRSRCPSPLLHAAYPLPRGFACR